MSSDLLSLARSSLSAAGGGVTPKVRQIHLAVSRNAVEDAKKALAEIELLLQAHEAQLAIDGVGE